MGLFDRFKKKNGSSEVTATAQTTGMNQKLFRDITQDVAVYMYEVQITNQPGLSFFNDDKGFFEGFFQQHMNHSQLLQMKEMSPDMYMRVLGMHAFGAGAYVTGVQLRYKHPVSEFTEDEFREIGAAFQENDAYELALNMLHIPVDSNNKKVLDQVILVALNAAKKSAGNQLLSVQNIKAYMQVLYNAGISMYMLARK